MSFMSELDIERRNRAAATLLYQQRHARKEPTMNSDPTYHVTACDADGVHTETKTWNLDDALVEFGRLKADPTMTNVLLTRRDETTTKKVRECSRSTGYQLEGGSLDISTHPLGHGGQRAMSTLQRIILTIVIICCLIIFLILIWLPTSVRMMS